MPRAHGCGREGLTSRRSYRCDSQGRPELRWLLPPKDSIEKTVAGACGLTQLDGGWAAVFPRAPNPPQCTPTQPAPLQSQLSSPTSLGSKREMLSHPAHQTNSKVNLDEQVYEGLGGKCTGP